MPQLRVALLVFVTLIVLDRPAWSTDDNTGATSSSSTHRDNQLLHGAVDQVQRGWQGSSTEGSLRIPRPGADLKSEQSSRALMPPNLNNGRLLDVNQPIDIKPPLLSVQDTHKSNREGLGLLGMYALCADNARIPYYITNVFPPSELNQCGVESGDLLTRINGVSPFEYMHSIHPITPGATIILTFEHNGIPKTVSAKLQEMQTFTPFFESYAQWAVGHITFLKDHQGQYRSCGLF